MRNVSTFTPAYAGIVASTILALLFAAGADAADKCHGGESSSSDALSIAGVRAAIARACPCAAYDGSSDTTDHKAFASCAASAVADAADGTPLLGFSLRSACKGELKKLY